MRGTGTAGLPAVGVAAMLALLLAAAPHPARAGVCDESSQASLDMCAESHRVAADKRLNEAYAKVQARLGAPDDGRQRDALRDAERAWIAFRDSECRLESAISYGGTIYPMQLAECAARLSDERAAVLARMAACHSGSGDCVLGP